MTGMREILRKTTILIVFKDWKQDYQTHWFFYTGQYLFFSFLMIKMIMIQKYIFFIIINSQEINLMSNFRKICIYS